MFKKILFVVAVLVLVSAGAAFAAGEKVYVCHYTNSDTNPTVLISVSENAVDTQLAKGDYLLPEGQTTCDEVLPPPTSE